jgi:hypothetical protein
VKALFFGVSIVVVPIVTLVFYMFAVNLIQAFTKNDTRYLVLEKFVDENKLKHRSRPGRFLNQNRLLFQQIFNTIVIIIITNIQFNHSKLSDFWMKVICILIISIAYIFDIVAMEVVKTLKIFNSVFLIFGEMILYFLLSLIAVNLTCLIFKILLIPVMGIRIWLLCEDLYNIKFIKDHAPQLEE